MKWQNVIQPANEHNWGTSFNVCSFQIREKLIRWPKIKMKLLFSIYSIFGGLYLSHNHPSRKGEIFAKQFQKSSKFYFRRINADTCLFRRHIRLDMCVCVSPCAALYVCFLYSIQFTLRHLLLFIWGFGLFSIFNKRWYEYDIRRRAQNESKLQRKWNERNLSKEWQFKICICIRFIHSWLREYGGKRNIYTKYSSSKNVKCSSMLTYALLRVSPVP